MKDKKKNSQERMSFGESPKLSVNPDTSHPDTQTLKEDVTSINPDICNTTCGCEVIDKAYNCGVEEGKDQERKEFLEMIEKICKSEQDKIEEMGFRDKEQMDDVQFSLNNFAVELKKQLEEKGK